MGVLTDEPVSDGRSTGAGALFVRIFDEDMDDEDRAMVRHWIESGVSINELWKRINPHYPVGRSTIDFGVPRLRARWES